uniref:RNA polymerase subunit beta 1 n=1 Tax=Hyalomonas oviformis TaxID=40531 RepID=UPI00226CCA41|nr:RNA polymerase subunit beta 1 [Hyalomonas oviformis]UZA61993.1 RNA polymerase subunit beta 1 [Hyalomonas oviformis]
MDYYKREPFIKRTISGLATYSLRKDFSVYKLNKDKEKNTKIKVKNLKKLEKDRYFLLDFVEIQRKSFFYLLEKGLIDEFCKRNPILSNKKDIELFFYPEYYKLTIPKYNPQQAILKGKSYTSKLYIPVQLSDKKTKNIRLKWAYIGNIPLMTKKGHFILNGAARVIVNQMIRSPGIYYQEKLYETFSQQWSVKAEVIYKRYYADLICLRGTWLRLEMDKDKNIWAKTKKGPKIPLFWLLIAMGLSERIIFKSVIEPQRLVQNLDHFSPARCNAEPAALASTIPSTDVEACRPPAVSATQSVQAPTARRGVGLPSLAGVEKKGFYSFVKNPPEAWREIYSLVHSSLKKNNNATEMGRKWLFNKFMNPRVYDLGKQGRLAFNRKLGLNVHQTMLTLTPQDLLYATDYLIKVEKGLKPLDDIDHLKHRRVRTSGELIQLVVGTGLVRLEKYIKEKINKLSSQYKNGLLTTTIFAAKAGAGSNKKSIKKDNKKDNKKDIKKHNINLINLLTINNLISSKAFNSVLREFFGTSPLSQFMDQINPLAEITHKRRLSSMGPGGVTRDSATLAIRGIHPTHYGRICPIETPEGKNAGLVNSMTTYARINPNGMLESPFYKVYKGIVQKQLGMFFLSAEQEEKTKIAAADIFVSSIGFLPQAPLTVIMGQHTVTKIPRNEVAFVGVSALQMISIATSLIPFLEHDDANRALMGSNMQRQAVPLIRPERPIVGTGLEARTVSDSGHVIQAKESGVITYVSSDRIIVTTIL